MDREITIRVKARWVRLALVILATAVVAFPAGALASHQFSDVPDSNIFHNDISAVKNAGVTLGCNAAGTLYCPSDYVTREQMAAFMNRLGALDPAKTPVVRAASAVDSDKVDGRHASDLVAAGFHITRDGSNNPVVEDWFNNVNGVAPTITGSAGDYDIDVGFATATKFAVCSVDTNFVDTRDALCTISTPGSNLVRVRTFDTGANALAAAEFWVIVYGE